MAIDPAASGPLSPAHVSLNEAGAIARNASRPGSTFELPAAGPLPRREARASTRPGQPSASYAPHTAVRSNVNADPSQWDGMLDRLGQKYNVPPLFLKAVMLIESGGRPDAVGDSGHSLGLFQLHDQGYGAGMGDLRFDPEANADRAARGLAEAWHAGVKAGYGGEFALRSAYDYSFNPGGGFAYQGDALVETYNRLLAAQGLPTVS